MSDNISYETKLEVGCRVRSRFDWTKRGRLLSHWFRDGVEVGKVLWDGAQENGTLPLRDLERIGR